MNRFTPVLIGAAGLTGAVIYALMSGADSGMPPDAAIPPAKDDQVEQVAETESQVDTTMKRDWQSSGYVGSGSCATCHAEIASTYAEHPMAQTMSEVAAAKPVESIADGGVEFEVLGRRYRVERTEDRLIHTEFMLDAAGNSVYEQSVDVHYAVGSGQNGRTYLIDRGGILFGSPVAWYTEDQRWDLSPGYHSSPETRFGRRITDDCVQCHSGHVVPVGDGTSGRFAAEPFPETGIGCEKCHGPGEEHVRLMESGDQHADGASASELLIVNPAQLEGRYAESICGQCHMEGHRRILRKGRTFHDFRPGMLTEDIWTVFVSPTPFESSGDAKFTSQTQQMHSSACFLGSEGAMRCTSCHDPHRMPKAAERVAFYRDRCNSCHLDHGCSLPPAEREKPPAFDSCIHCHMPVIGASNVPHTTFTDHRVLRQPTSESELPSDSNAGEVWTIFDDADQRMPSWEVDRARALALADQAIYRRARHLIGDAVAALEGILDRDPDDLAALQKLGFLYSTVGDPRKAGRIFERALQVSPDDEMSLKNLGLMAFRTGSRDVGLRSYSRFRGLNPWDATMYGPYAALLAGAGDMSGALAAVEHGLDLDPTQRELRDLAIRLNARVGRRQQSRRHAEILGEIRRQFEPWDEQRR